MIFTDLQEVTAYRMHKPVWAAAPTSGAGAGLHGGRVNRPGIDTLYLSLDSQTAISEYQQTSSLLPPGTLITYIVTASRIVDFRNGYGQGWPALWQEFYCDWRKLWFGEHREPPSWRLGDQVLELGARGILFCSVSSPDEHNLALFTQQLNADDRIKVYDPDHRLPKNQESGHS